MSISEPLSTSPVVPVGVVMRETLADILSTMEDVDAVVGATLAARAQLVDSARLMSEAMAVEQASDGAVPYGREPKGWNSAVRLRRELVFDIAVRLRIPERSAETLIGESQALLHRLTATHRLLADGAISYGHVKVLVDATAGLPEEVAAGFEAELLPAALELTVAKFREHARRRREALHPETIDERRRAAAADRAVWLDPQRDGMTQLTALLTAETAAAAHDRITRIAEANGTAGDTRTLAQRRADALSDLLIDGDTCTAGTPVGHGIRPQVMVTVPVLTLIGTGTAPGNLSGYGPIGPETARELAARAPSFARILTDPVTSAILDFDRSKYAVPADLTAVLRLQHETCSAPGCNRPAQQCDLDHTTAYSDDGTTCLANLAPLCPTHHNLKHHSSVSVRKIGDGAMEWTTPTGRVVVVQPTTRLDDGMLRRGGTPGPDPGTGQEAGHGAGQEPGPDPGEPPGGFPF